MPDAKQETKCPKCGDALVEGKSYCPNCGLALGSQVDRTAIDSYIQARIAQELSARLKDQGSLVREIGDRAEDVVWVRLKRYGWIVIALTVILGLWGLKSIDDAGNKIVETARQRVEPLIQNTEARAKVAQGEIAKTADKVTEFNKTLPALDSKLATALGKVSAYEKRMQAYEGRISKSGDTALTEIAQLREKVDRQQKNLNETGGLVRELQGQVIDLGKREVRAQIFRTTGPGPSFTAYGALGCPTVADALAKYDMLVAYCTQGTPPALFQLTSTELRAVSSLSPVGFQDVSTAPKRTCTASNRGTFYVEKGTGRVADKPFLCGKKSDNTYDWVQLGLIP